MKIKIKTEFWDMRDLDEWKKRYQSLGVFMMMGFLFPMGYAIFVQQWFLFGYSLVMFFCGMLVYVSYNKWLKVK